MRVMVRVKRKEKTMENIINMDASVTVHFDNLPIDLIKNIVTQLVDDTTLYLNEVFALRNTEFHIVISGCDDIIL